MATTYTVNNRFSKQGTGDNQDTWGAVLNSGVFDIVDEAISGVHVVDVTTASNVTLSTNNGATDEARNMTLQLVGTPTASIDVIVPNQAKMYLIDGTGFLGVETITVKGTTGTGVAITTGKTAVVMCDGVNVVEIYLTPDAATASQETYPGDHKYSDRAVDHGFWLLKDGRTLDSVTNTQYADLFGQIGTRYGGTGASNFLLPDWSGRMAIGLDDIAGVSAGVVTDANASIPGGMGGSELRTGTGTNAETILDLTQIPGHEHNTVASANATIGSLSGTEFFAKGGTSGSGADEKYSSAGVVTPSPTLAPSETVGGGLGHTHALTMDEQSDMNPYVAMYAFMRF